MFSLETTKAVNRTVKTNDLKKGIRVQLRNGWYAKIMDNKKGNTRICDVKGIYRETGSVYSHDIVLAQLDDGYWHVVEHTPAQLKLKKIVDGM